MKIPVRKWAHVTTELITNLLESNGFIASVAFVDKLTKMVDLARRNKKFIVMEYA